MSTKPFPVTVHPFASPTPGSCAYERGSSSYNALVHIGGLTSGPHTSPCLEPLIQSLQDHHELSYSFWEFRMRSSYTGFGYSSLAYDVADLSALVTYLRSMGKKKIVLLGSSTGCQAIMEYTNSKRNTPNVDAYIMQAPTSDRETAAQLMSPDFYARTLQHAEDMIMLEDEDEIMPGVLVPSVFTSPLSAYRWHSLIAKGGDDDFFSSDLDEATLVRTFGRLGKPTLLMPSENDEMVPQSVDKEALLRKWTDAAPKGVVSDLSGVNPGADHGLSEEEARAWFSDRVVRFLHTLGEL